MFKIWDDEKPEPGTKVVIVCDDGASCSLGLVVTYSPDAKEGTLGVIDAEDGCPLEPSYLSGALWAALPHTYPVYFMEAHDDV